MYYKYLQLPNLSGNTDVILYFYVVSVVSTSLKLLLQSFTLFDRKSMTFSHPLQTVSLGPITFFFLNPFDLILDHLATHALRWPNQINPQLSWTPECTPINGYFIKCLPLFCGSLDFLHIFFTSLYLHSRPLYNYNVGKYAQTRNVWYILVT